MNILHPANKTIGRKRNKALGVPELIAIALGGMIGGGIFTILGISVAMIGVFTPLAIMLGGIDRFAGGLFLCQAGCLL